MWSDNQRIVIQYGKPEAKMPLFPAIICRINTPWATSDSEPKSKRSSTAS